jgi:hypothetical protein
VVAIAPFLGLRQPHWIATLNLLSQLHPAAPIPSATRREVALLALMKRNGMLTDRL